MRSKAQYQGRRKTASGECNIRRTAPEMSELNSVGAAIHISQLTAVCECVGVYDLQAQ